MGKFATAVGALVPVVLLISSGCTLPSQPSGFHVSTPYYEANISSDGILRVNSLAGKSIIAGADFLASYSGAKAKVVTSSVTERQNEVVVTYETPVAQYEVAYSFPGKSPEIEVSTKATYSKDTRVDQEALVVHTPLPVTRVFANDEPALKGFVRINTGHRGAILGAGATSLRLIDQEEISSVEVARGGSTLNNLLSFTPITDSGVGRGGSWVMETNSHYYSGSALEGKAGDSLRYEFDARRIGVMVTRQPHGGKLAVLVDGQQIGEITTSNDTETNRYIPFVSADLGTGHHVIELNVLAGGPVSIEGFVMDSSSITKLDGPWARYSPVNGFPFMCSLALTSEYNSALDLTFSGTSVSLYGPVGPNFGVARVIIDGKPEAEIDQYSPNEYLAKELYAVSGLKPGPHTIRYESTGTHNPYATKQVVGLSQLESSDQDNVDLVVSLDKNDDHPHVQMDTSAIYAAATGLTRQAGETYTKRFQITVGDVGPVVQKLSQPGGRLATVMISEHADMQSLEGSLAIAYGRSDAKQNQGSGATGAGLVGQGLTYTKTFFTSSERLPPGALSLAQPAGLSLAKELAEDGVEIGLHTPSNWLDDRKTVQSALEFMKENFGTVTWIDHAPQVNREDLSADGLNSRSPYYVVGILKQEGIRYVWEYGSELHRSLNVFQKPARRESALAFWTEAGQPGLVVFPSIEVIGARAFDWYLAPQQIDRLISSYGVASLHTYLSSSDRLFMPQGLWHMEGNVAVIDPTLNDHFRYLAEEQRKGDLWVPTVRDFMDFQTALSKVYVASTGPGDITVQNVGASPVKGVTLRAVSASKATAEGRPLPSRTVNGDLVFWLDLQPNSEVALHIQ